MQALLRPTSRSTAAPLLRPASSPSSLLPHLPSTPCTITPLFLRRPYLSTSSEALSPSPTRFFSGYPSPLLGPKRGISVHAAASFASSGGKSERAKLAQVIPGFLFRSCYCFVGSSRKSDVAWIRKASMSLFSGIVSVLILELNVDLSYLLGLSV